MRILGWLVIGALWLGCSDPDPGDPPFQCDTVQSNEAACRQLCQNSCGFDLDCCYAVDGEWRIYEADCGPCPPR